MTFIKALFVAREFVCSAHLLCMSADIYVIDKYPCLHVLRHNGMLMVERSRAFRRVSRSLSVTSYAQGTDVGVACVLLY